MAYIPKSKLNIKTTNGKEFRSVRTKKAYVGKYMQLSNGKLLIGSNPLNPGGELEPLSPPANNLGFSADVRLHQNLKPEISLQLGKVKDIPFAKNTPTEDDYTNGYFIRYFVKKANQNTFYKEVSKEVYDSLIKKKSEYDVNLYQPGQIKWAIRGNVRNVNKSLLLKAEKRYPNISLLYPKLDEFNRAETINNQFARQGELYYRDEPGREYVGSYHIHPIKGPMVGAFHRNTPHDRLIFAEDLVRRNNEVQPTQPTSTSTLPEGFIDISNTPYADTPTPSTPSTPTTPSAPSTPSTPSAPSGGGGGGY